MSKPRTVRLTVQNNTEGSDQTEIGTADIHDISNGDMIVDLNITNPEIAEQLGGVLIKGIIPRRATEGLEGLQDG